MRLDKYGRQLFSKKVNVLNSINVIKEEDGKYKLGISGREIAFDVIAVDLDDGDIEVPKTPVEYMNTAAMIEIGKFSELTAGAFEIMLIQCFEALDSQEYKDAVTAQTAIN